MPAALPRATPPTICTIDFANLLPPQQVRVLVDDIVRSMAELPLEVGGCPAATAAARSDVQPARLLRQPACLAGVPTMLLLPSTNCSSHTTLLHAPRPLAAPRLFSPQAQAHPKLGKQLEYLGKLVRATVQAMATQQPSGAVH